MKTELTGFMVICRNCDSEAELHFDAGYIHDCGGDTGYLMVFCPSCGKSFDAGDGQ